MARALIPIFYFLIIGLPLVLSAVPILLSEATFARFLAILFAPSIYILGYVTTAGLLATPFRKAIFPGIFPRDLKHKIYGPRRLYGAAWTAIYYFTPLYFLSLSIPSLRKYLFRLFGYQFSMQFTIYPDVWLRDLTCVKFEDGAYLANKSSLGTNMCLLDGTILVDRIKIGKNSMVGHSALIGPGVNFQDNVETSVFNILGIRARLNSGVRFGAGVGASHGVTVGENTDVGHYAYLGTKCTIGPNIRIPGGANIPAGAIVNTQDECDSYYSSETQSLNSLRQELFTKIDEGTLSQGAGLRTAVKNDGTRSSAR